MALRDEIPTYIDGNGLVAPNLIGAGTLKGSDNGPMYTSELYVMLQKLGQLTDQDKVDFQNLILKCVNYAGMLCRVPVGQDDGEEAPDDYYGTLNGCFTLGNTTIPRIFLKSMIVHLGFMDNENPGSHSNWDTFLFRQLQLVCSMITASFPSLWNPIHWIIRLVCWPLYFYSAICISVSCINTPITSADPRRLSWHLVQVLRNRSVMCRIASWVWYDRLKGDYGSAEMQGVAAQYYHDNHPFIRYWVS